MGLTTFSTALSGLATNSQGLNVVGNNLANLNTVGFKGSNINFVDVLGQTFSTAGTAESGTLMSIGLGSQVGSVRQVQSQGTLQTTSNPLDVAIEGKGFLVVKTPTGQYYTRAGNMHLDANGYLVSDSGAQIQGYSRNPLTGQVDNTLGLGAIKIPTGVDSPLPTTLFELAMNLDANEPDGAQFTTPIQIYDSLGNTHVATLTLEKEITGGATPSTKWRFDITIPNNEIAGVAPTNTQKFSLITGAVAAAGSPTAGALSFDTTGKLVSAWIGADPATPPALADLTFPPGSVTLPSMADGGKLNTNFTWNLLSPTGAPQVTGFASPDEVTASSHDGQPAGSLNNLTIGTDGTITAVYSNGGIAPIAQIVLARFLNEDGLVPQGGGLYSQTLAAGDLAIGVPGQGGRGRLLSSSLEQSNVDLAAELTKIITFQRGYQANARMITVTDQIMQETMNLRQ
jgi:flagellar hook protein FlgE